MSFKRFKDREEAGKELAKALSEYRNKKDVVIVALPRGGVVLGRIIADALRAPLDIVVPRKIALPENEEYAIGAITEAGDAVWNEEEQKGVAPQILKKIIEKEKNEAGRRLALYRQGLPPRDLKNKIAVIVDDGVATGYTLRAAIKTVRAAGAKKIIVAVTGGPADTINELKKEADEVVALSVSPFISAVGYLYEEFLQVDDKTVIRLMKKQIKKQ